ncbi:helix-turn-helix domain-containing protein [Entomobacter blattae]|uniref:Helix-turn-helix domain protein n=1 Tax=Entomobacter blattae TaxID=2762277 RepID=A0A7H1NQ12_9PROT|nr:helix-turn-helix transcriptional regulator [Entomobacter blattae]QNT77872.1 Helix-turn-helix domain protein [Entomobacter blattae]
MVKKKDEMIEFLGTQETLGQRIRLLRKLEGFTQEDIANKLGVSRSAVAHWETNREGSVREHLPNLAKLLNVPVEVFLTGMASQSAQMEISIDEIDLLKLYRQLTTLERLSIQRSITRLIKHREKE